MNRYNLITILNRIPILFLVIFVTLQSCDNKLDTSSETSLSSATIFDTEARIEGLTNGLYKSMKAGNLYSGYLLLYGDLRAEDFVCRTENALTGGYVWSNTFANTTGDITNTWEQLYSVINNVNNYIAGLESSEVISATQKNHYLGEAYFLRGLAYFHLVTLYAQPYTKDQGTSKGIPLRLIAENSSEHNDLARSTVAEVYAQIVDDLNKAEQLLPESYESKLKNTTRAHKNTAIALKTRVFLSKGEYASVVSEAIKIVPQTVRPFSATTGVKATLQDDVTSIFYSDYTSTESILSFPMTASDTPSGVSLSEAFYANRIDYVLNNSSTGIISDTEWRETDKRRTFVTFNTTIGEYTLAKFKHVSPSIDYVPAIRYAEVLLNYAEAAAKTGNLSLAAELLKAVRLRSDNSYEFSESALSANNIEATIAKEKRIELLGEGLRATDILRKLDIFPVKPTLSSMNPVAVGPNDKNYIFPIPNTEILTNKLINQ